jgi:hypothetical protein
MCSSAFQRTGQRHAAVVEIALGDALLGADDVVQAVREDGGSCVSTEYFVGEDDAGWLKTPEERRTKLT